MKKRSDEEVEKNKIYATNNVLVEALACFQDLVGIKSNYIGKLTDNPLVGRSRYAEKAASPDKI